MSDHGGRRWMKIPFSICIIVIGTAAANAQQPAKAPPPGERFASARKTNDRLHIARWFSLQDVRAKAAPDIPRYDLHIPRPQIGTEDIMVFDKRQGTAPEPFGSAELDHSLRHMFNAGGDLIKRPADCHSGYTTVGGQPASGADLDGPVGVGDCYW